MIDIIPLSPMTLDNYSQSIVLILTNSRVAKPILPIVNPENVTIAWFFGLICIHIGYWKLLRLVGIETNCGQHFLLAN